jgi:hypothetical protein
VWGKDDKGSKRVNGKNNEYVRKKSEENKALSPTQE